MSDLDISDQIASECINGKSLPLFSPTTPVSFYLMDVTVNFIKLTIHHPISLKPEIDMVPGSPLVSPDYIPLSLMSSGNDQWSDKHYLDVLRPIMSLKTDTGSSMLATDADRVVNGSCILQPLISSLHPSPFLWNTLPKFASHPILSREQQQHYHYTYGTFNTLHTFCSKTHTAFNSLMDFSTADRLRLNGNTAIESAAPLFPLPVSMSSESSFLIPLILSHDFSMEFTQPSEIGSSPPHGSLTIVPCTKENLDTFVLMPTPAQRGMAKGQLRNMKMKSGEASEMDKPDETLQKSGPEKDYKELNEAADIVDVSAISNRLSSNDEIELRSPIKKLFKRNDENMDRVLNQMDFEKKFASLPAFTPDDPQKGNYIAYFASILFLLMG
ncbi:unnamed protein product [Onchocerca flexuosa]|uniref:EF-hand domain-containing protein n=1 Tax=Onchocerca flexuosa TaxID=387005 RepID=A0A183H7Y6_9BILA|nr:unnamed protein product [Onchocerca flexuosa]